MVGHIAGTGQVVKSELRRGSVPPAAKNRAFLGRCIEALPQGVRVSRFRADAASYQASVVNACREHGARFAIRARADRTVRAVIAAVPEDAWQPLPREDGTLSETESVARTVPVMGGTPEAFCLVVQRRAVRPASGDPERCADRVVVQPAGRQFGKSTEGAPQRLRRGPSALQRVPRQRGIPGPDAIAYNLLCLMRLSLPSAWHGRRAGTFRYRLYAMAGQVVRHARQRTLKVGPARPGLPEETLWRMRTCRLF